MVKINFKNLNKLEIEIHETLSDFAKDNDIIRIGKAAELCNCSPSKISKFVKKLGFTNYKQYQGFLHGKDISNTNQTSELLRIQQFINNFDNSMVEKLVNLIDNHEKIVLFGYGPSLICAQYFEYRLRVLTNKTIVAVADEISVSSTVDENTLLILLTVTGTFHSFQSLYTESKKIGAEVAMVVEEYNAKLINQCDRIFWLSKHPQSTKLLPYEKSRTVFFIFLEEVIQSIMNKKKTFHK